MKKDGFVFIESIVVLVIVALSLAMLLSSYSLIGRKTKEKEFYDKASDKYLLYALSVLGTDDACNYSVESDCNGHGDGHINFKATRSNCSTTKMGILYDCAQIFKDYNIEYIYVVDDVYSELNKSSAVNTYDNGTIEYMKTLKKCNDSNEEIGTTATGEKRYNNTRNASCTNPIKYMIGVFKRSETDYYYASIEL